MNILRASLRSIASVLAGCTALLGTHAATAQEYPAQPIRIVAPSPPGGGTDLLARLFGRHLSERLGTPVVVENKAGAAGLVGTTFVSQAPADGYTLLVTYQVHAANKWLVRDMPYDPLDDFQPISQLVFTPYILVVNPELAAKTLGDLIALAKSKPGALNFGSAGPGSGGHLVGEFFNQQFDLKTNHVPYKGSAPLVMDLIAGNVQYAFDSTTAVPHVQSGRLRALAVTSDERVPALPSVPTTAEAGFPKLQPRGWYGFFAPKDTPPSVVKRLHGEIVAIMSIPEVNETLVANGFVPTASETPETYRAFVASEIENWGGVVKAAGITPK